jgi:hypothetical protein
MNLLNISIVNGNQWFGKLEVAINLGAKFIARVTGYLGILNVANCTHSRACVGVNQSPYSWQGGYGVVHQAPCNLNKKIEITINITKLLDKLCTTGKSSDNPTVAGSVRIWASCHSGVSPNEQLLTFSEQGRLHHGSVLSPSA